MIKIANTYRKERDGCMEMNVQLTASQEQAIRQAVTNTRLEGYEPSDECKADLARIIRGGKTIGQAVDDTIGRYKNA